MTSRRKQFITIFFIILLLLILTFSLIKLLPFINSLQIEENQIKFETFISNLGLSGMLLLLLIQILQVFIAFIPGEIVELLAGLLYGPWGGLILCLIGNAIGSFLIYVVVKFFAKKHAQKIQSRLTNYNFLNNKKKIAIYLFFIYLIPGIPKDIITYLVPFLPINFLGFIIVTSIARIPSIISSTYSSSSFLHTNYTTAIIILASFSIIAIIGFIFKDKILNFIKNNNKEKIDNSSK